MAYGMTPLFGKWGSFSINLIDFEFYTIKWVPRDLVVYRLYAVALGLVSRTCLRVFYFISLFSYYQVIC